MIADHGPIRGLLELRDFDGWTFDGLWEDVKFDFRHARDIERLAIVGGKRWHEAMATFCKPFTTAKIRYFESFEITDARDWLMKERPGEKAGAHSISSMT
ncbi:MAG: STAS/SEC14 domain-containing protein [Planctomycetaceae bacterium]